MPCGQPLAYPAGISTLACVWQNLTASAIEDSMTRGSRAAAKWNKERAAKDASRAVKEYLATLSASCASRK